MIIMELHGMLIIDIKSPSTTLAQMFGSPQPSHQDPWASFMQPKRKLRNAYDLTQYDGY